jgi:hypothetical protein
VLVKVQITVSPGSRSIIARRSRMETVLPPSGSLHASPLRSQAPGELFLDMVLSRVDSREHSLILEPRGVFQGAVVV